MTKFLDGPAGGKSIDLRRCPHFLRVVISEAGELDALDQLSDEPRADEKVYVYEIEPGSWGEVYVRPGGRFEHGRYRHLAHADGEAVRETEAWRKWTAAENEKRQLGLLAPWPQDDAA